MNLNNLALKISSLVSKEVDGDFLLLLEQYIPTALKSVCKMISLAQPTGHEKLILNFGAVSVDDFVPIVEYDAIHIPSSVPQLIVHNPLHFVHLVDSVIGTVKMENANSLDSLSLAISHGVPYYYIQEPYIIIYIPAKYTTGTGVNIISHAYTSLANFPLELEEYLIAELVKLIQTNEK